MSWGLPSCRPEKPVDRRVGARFWSKLKTCICLSHTLGLVRMELLQDSILQNMLEQLPPLRSFDGNIMPDEGPVFKSQLATPKKYASYLIRTLKRLPEGATSRGVMFFIHGMMQHARSVELTDLQNMFLKEQIIWFGIDAPGHGLGGRLGDPTMQCPSS